ncbi:hypothetical protein ACFE04_029388 [Oxalis oulophora]
MDGSRQLRSGFAGSTDGGGGPGWTNAVRENQVLKVGMDNMRMRVSELEKECSDMRQEIEKLGHGGKGSSTTAWGNVSKKLGFNIKSQMCSAQEGAVSKQQNINGKGKVEKVKDRHEKHKNSFSQDDDE